MWKGVEKRLKIALKAQKLGISWEYFHSLVIDNKGMEEGLIQKVRSDNDNEAFLKILDEHIRMIQSIVNNFEVDCGNFQVSRDDMIQEGTIALLEACKTYRECYDTKFSTYAYTIIKRRIQRYYYDEFDKYNEERFSLDNLEVYDHCSFIAYDNKVDFTQCVHNRAKLESLIEKLSEEDKQIVRMRIDSYTYDEIAKYLHINRKRIDNRLYRIRQKFSNKL